MFKINEGKGRGDKQNGKGQKRIKYRQDNQAFNIFAKNTK